MVVVMSAIEIENDRNVISGKVVMVGSIVKPVGIIAGIEPVIQFQPCVKCINRFIDLVQVS